MPESQSPWQQYFREKVGPFDKGMILKDADNYQDIARKFMPRDNH
jgi:dihydroxy-acid dehydratase